MKRLLLALIGLIVAWAAASGPFARAAGAAGSDPHAGETLQVGPGHKVLPEAAAAGGQFGASVAMWAHTAVVGAPGAGAAYAFSMRHGAVFVQEAMLAPDAPAPGFGAAAAVWGDTALVGAPGGAGASAPGEVHVFVRRDDAWAEEAVLAAADGLPGDLFGASVALSGDTAAVGAPGADGAAGPSGAAYVFTRQAGVWTQRAKLVARDGVPGGELGASIGAWANAIVVGAPYADGAAPGAGAAYVFGRTMSGWIEEAKLVAPSGAELDRYGASVAMSGDRVAVGAPGAAPSGAAYVLARQGGAWALEAELLPNDATAVELGLSVALWDDAALVGAGHAVADPSSASLFLRRGGAWSFARKLMERHPGPAEPSCPVALAQTAAIVGASNDAAQGPLSGAAIAFPVARVGVSAASTLDCGSATTLNSLSVCIRNQMPRSGSNGFAPPSAQEQADWRTVVAAMLNGACDFALPPSLAAAMRVQTFTDVDNNKSYCVLMEVNDADSDGFVDMGWGTFVVDAAAARELSHQAPHPLFDSGTEAEAIDLFKWTDARSYLMCGAHRLANDQPSACDIDYGEADCAHATETMYQPTVVELEAFYNATGYTQVQWHGMGSSTCPGVNAYLSQGLSTAPPAGANVLTLEAQVELYNPTWVVDVTGGDTCSQNATRNVQGRLLNGVGELDVCEVAATDPSGRFVSIEQQPEYRAASDWATAVKDTWPPASAPEPPEGLSATAGNGEVMLSWIASSGATSYSVWRSTTAGGPFAPAAVGATYTSYIDTGLSNGTTYFYVITALNDVGESGASAEVSATPSGPPPAPTDLSATPGKRKVTLGWTASPGATSYSVKQSATAGGPYAVIAAVTGTSYMHRNLTAGVTYYYVVTAVSSFGESGPSNEASATPY